ncbi:isochorismate synthase [Corynebacterium sp. 13CS0277]|uniref:isochorismate synthase n=1 Tax=Corynebacterium sp. 13CS0277 TaxID=2071994 RepID=UPI000D0458C9|nr:chorismate-binding protein [Corynebacterium sp. 13CS0277]PRQ11218.1 isochorismate synthase [Corynebacterium sp. 13CS0277]
MVDSRPAGIPAGAPDFLLSREHSAIRTRGRREVFRNPWDAVEALRSGAVDIVVGALPFLPTSDGTTAEITSGVASEGAPAALTVPEHIERSSSPLEPPAYYRASMGAPVHSRVLGMAPGREEHLATVAAAIATMERTSLDKVVLARRVDVECTPGLDPRLIAARLLHDEELRNCFLADLSPAGGGTLVGSSPEVLIQKQGRRISVQPLAGSRPRRRATAGSCAARSAHNARDFRAAEAELLASSKDLAEHAFVVQHLQEALAPLARNLRVEGPFVTGTTDMWHLATRIEGEVDDAECTALELALLLHPTPAVCGTPTEEAYALIDLAEGDSRGFYAGAVGWADRHGDGEFMVAIRCAEVSPDGRHLRAWAGGGIVASSDPQAEYAETTAKLRTIMRTLGFRPEEYSD